MTGPRLPVRDGVAPPKQVHARPLTDDELERAGRLHDEGWSWAEIRRRFLRDYGVSWTAPSIGNAVTRRRAFED